MGSGSSHLPFKRYEIGKVFRDGPVKTGRDREFLQCDVDIVGLPGCSIEAELISLWLKGYKDLEIDIYIKYNSRNLSARKGWYSESWFWFVAL